MFCVFKLETERNNHPMAGELFGTAELFDPDGKQVAFEANDLKVVRKSREDNGWEQRVMGAAIGFVVDKGYKFEAMLDDSGHPNGHPHLYPHERVSAYSHKRIWMIVASKIPENPQA